jgi:hypothetical protein
MVGLDHAVIRMKLEKLKQEIEAGPSGKTRAEETAWLRAKLKELVEILLYLGT